MKQDGLLLGRLGQGCILHCAANFSRVRLLTIPWDWCPSGRLLSSVTGLIPCVGFSSVSPWWVVKKSVVSFVTPTGTEPLGFTPASMMSWSHTNMTQPMPFHNIPAALEIFVL